MAYVNLMAIMYPIGSVYQSTNNTSPASLFGGTWAAVQDRFLLGAGKGYSPHATGGETTHTLTINEMPSHQHGNSGNWKWEVSSGSNTGANQIGDSGNHDGNATMQSNYYVGGGGGAQQHAALLRRLHLVSHCVVSKEAM